MSIRPPGHADPSAKLGISLMLAKLGQKACAFLAPAPVLNALA